MATTIMELYKEYKKDVYIYLISLTHDQSIAEDLTSEAFVSAIKALPNFQGKSEIKTWLFSIARNKWYDYLRHEKKSTTINERLQCYLQDDNPSAENMVVRSEILARISVLLDNEKPQNKKIAIMRIDGYSYYEIAKECSISESSARVIDFRVRKKLRDILEKEGFTYE